MKRKTVFVVVTAAGAIATVLALSAGRVEAPTQPAQPALHTTAQSGYVANLNPTTGKVSTQPTTTTSALQQGLSTSSQGLTEVPSPVAGGGTMVELNGRFRNIVSATIDGSGALKTQCNTKAAPPAATREGGQR